MIALMAEMNRRALDLRVPLSIRLDVTCRYNERRVHCYLDHADHGEVSTAGSAICSTSRLMPGVFFLTEILMRMHSGQMLVFNYTFTSFHGNQATHNRSPAGTGATACRSAPSPERRRTAVGRWLSC